MEYTHLRSFLFVPATQPERIVKALDSNADIVIVDLEDAVAPDEKSKGRQALSHFLDNYPSAQIIVRVNPVTSREFREDISLCGSYAGIVGVMLPKVETVHQIEQATAIKKPVWPLIETARGLIALSTLVFTQGIERLTFGSVDLATDLNLKPGSAGADKLLDQCRYELVLCSRSAGLPPPVESVVPEINDLSKVENTAIQASEMGFSGMLCIHPKQLSIIHSAFSPSEHELAWAHQVIEGASRCAGAFQLHGKMIDAPVIERAKMLLRRAKQ